MSAQPAGLTRPPEGILTGAVQDSSFDISSSESGGTTESYREAFEHALLFWRELMDQLPNVAARQSLGLGFHASFEPGSGIISISPSEQVEETFNRLAEQWRAATMFLSSPADVFLHPLYLQIIGMGSDILPLLLQETRREPGDWFLALRSIARADPVREEDAGDAVKMGDAWLRWAREQGYDV